MRQAGRYMKAYRDIREKYSLMEMFKNPELAAEITLQPVQAFAVDAAIIFADILLPLEGMGIGFEFAPGPVIQPSGSNRSRRRCAQDRRSGGGFGVCAEGPATGAGGNRREGPADRVCRRAVYPGRLCN